MIIKDHLNIPALCGLSPLVGKNEKEWGPRFPNMHNCYDQDLRKIGHEGKKNKPDMKFLKKRIKIYLFSCGGNWGNQNSRGCLFVPGWPLLRNCGRNEARSSGGL